MTSDSTWGSLVNMLDASYKTINQLVGMEKGPSYLLYAMHIRIWALGGDFANDSSRLINQCDLYYNQEKYFRFI